MQLNCKQVDETAADYGSVWAMHMLHLVYTW